LSILYVYHTEKTPYLNLTPDNVKITKTKPNFVLLREPFDL